MADAFTQCGMILLSVCEDCRNVDWNGKKKKIKNLSKQCLQV